MRSQHQQRIDDMMAKAGQNLPDKPTIPSEDVRILRARLIMEEALETIRDGLGISMQNKYRDMEEIQMENLNFLIVDPSNLELIADGCADLSVVTIGTLSACGIDDEELLQVVDENNLAKFVTEIVQPIGIGVVKCKTCGKVWETDTTIKIANVPAEDVRLPDYKCPNGCKPGYRDEFGKWIKPTGHKPPNIKAVLEKQR